MLVFVSTSGLKRAKWYEYVIRFSLGGLVTAGAALLAKKFGPEFGGLFLAFPAILAASASRRKAFTAGIAEGSQPARCCRRRNGQLRTDGIRSSGLEISAKPQCVDRSAKRNLALGTCFWPSLVGMETE